MQSISFQNISFPVVYLTALSYSKQARVYTNSRGYKRFLGYEQSEVSIRLSINQAAAMAAGRDFNSDYNALIAMQPDRESEPDWITIAGNVIYPALKFRVTSINRTFESDINGSPVAVEADLTLSGVACTKAETSRKSLEFTPEEVVQLPAVSIECGGKSLQIGENITLSSLVVQPDQLDAEFFIGDDLAIVNDQPWLMALAKKKGAVNVENLGKFYILSANLVDGRLIVKGTKFENLEAMAATFFDASLSAILSNLIPGSNMAAIGGQVKYFKHAGTPLQALQAIARCAGFLIDWDQNILSFFPVPDAIDPDETFEFYIDDDIATEEITGLVWSDGANEFIIGENPTIQVVSAFASTDRIHAERCLKYAKYMQNSITLTAPLDTRIKHHSAIKIIKDQSVIPCMVENYSFDFNAWTMTLELHYVER